MRRNSSRRYGTEAGAGMDDAGVQAMGTTPSIINLAKLEAEEVMLDELRARAGMETRTLRPSEGAHAAGLPEADMNEAPHRPVPALFAVSMPLVRMGMMNVVDDSFSRCFKSQKKVPWNWNAYLFPAWALGVAVRYTLLFPVRLLALTLGFLSVGIAFPIVKLLSWCMDTKRMEIALIQLLATSFVASWSGVVRIHGLRPTPRPGQPAGVFVANHSTMCDFVLLLQSHPYAVVGQHHPGWVGFLQDYLLKSINCVWFNRGESKDRRVVADRLRAHSHDASKAATPLLVFPEGTCVNNEYVVQFKKGVFELGMPINPVAIKYNKVFVDAYWNSRQQSFAQHLFAMMTSWAVVCDIWFMDQQTIRPGESAAAFAQRVQRLIAARAGLKPVDWDGYMKYWKPNARFIERQQKQVGEQLLAAFGIVDIDGGPAPASPTATAGTAAPSPYRKLDGLHADTSPHPGSSFSTGEGGAAASHDASDRPSNNGDGSAPAREGAQSTDGALLAADDGDVAGNEVVSAFIARSLATPTTLVPSKGGRSSTGGAPSLGRVGLTSAGPPVGGATSSDDRAGSAVPASAAQHLGSSLEEEADAAQPHEEDIGGGVGLGELSYVEGGEEDAPLRQRQVSARQKRRIS